MEAPTQGVTEQVGVRAVAHALLARGSAYEGVALVRGAIAREPSSAEHRELLAALLEGNLEDSDETLRLDLALVDAWIRHGMLVEALALLGGTPLGTAEVGQEWANLLGELLAPVPVDAEPTLREMYRELLSGGATVALSLLEDRAKRQPPLPKWAYRRLEVLRWLLIDNARSAEDERPMSTAGSTALGACLAEPLGRRNIRDAERAAQSFLERRPHDRDAIAVVDALAKLVAEMEAQAAHAQAQSRTIPMYGPQAAAMQLRMGNLEAAGAVYRRLIDEGADRNLRPLLAAVQVLLDVMAGRPVLRHFGLDEDDEETTTELEWSRPPAPSCSGPASTQEVTLQVGGSGDPLDVPLEGHALDVPLDVEAPTHPPPPDGELVIPGTSVSAAPAPAFSPADPVERSGFIPVFPPRKGDTVRRADVRDGDEGPTVQNPSADTSAAELELAGRFAEAESMYRALAMMHPGRLDWRASAERCRLRRLGYWSGEGRSGAPGYLDEDTHVLLRVIVPVQ
ncbi:MAG: hypothetical protein AB7S26_12925 [Sandaracinaceae bacterium]